MIPKLRKDVSRLERELARLRPGPVPGLLTSHTTRGVTRRPIRSSTTLSRSTNTVPRWG